MLTREEDGHECECDDKHCDSASPRDAVSKRGIWSRGSDEPSELIERLEEYRDLHGEDCEVRLMTQQNWPFENAITGLVSGAEINDAEADDDDEGVDTGTDVETDAVVYIVEGEQLGYGSKRAWETAH